jgi:GAF domain-containing protein
LLNQARLIGVLYLENNLAPAVFGPSRITVMKLLASQAATALDNTRLLYVADCLANKQILPSSEGER